MNNSSEYFTLYPCAGRTRTYTFSIDALTPPRTMTKHELAALYFPDEPKGELARKALYYTLLHARQPVGRLSDDDRALAREDGYVYLTDVLNDICPCDTAKQFLPAHVAAIMHFLGPAPDKEDYAALAA
ncbi:MAG: hypothetical protein IK011_05105 [Bacteroidaceae bacterium]|nr:hypothetical protein [Bacteroidaceae bacterium]